VNKIGIVFPGQGSQSIGMLSDIAKEFSEVEKIYAEASQVLGYDLWQLVQQGPSEELDKTIHTQPALLAASWAIWQIIKNNAPTIKPVLLAGHSLGEYTALVCAEALSFKEAIRLVAARGQYMQEAVPVGEGGIAAIVGLDDAVVQKICEQSVISNDVLTPANFNSPGQVVIAGTKLAVERAIVLAKEKGARLAKLLPVSVPSHCALMKPAADRLSQLLATLSIQAPSLPILNNVDVVVYQQGDDIRSGLVRQLYSPVRWVETIQKFAVEQIIECGPGKVLSGLIKRISPDVSLFHTADLNSLQHLLKTL